MQRHEFSFELDAPPEEVWNVFWYRGPDRPQPKDVKTRIEILHPGDEIGNGLVRHCYFPVPWWLGSKGVGQSWEWLTEVTPKVSWKYNAIGRPLWSTAEGRTRLEDLGNGTTRVHFSETYHAFNPIMRALLEKRVHAFISKDNDKLIKDSLTKGVKSLRAAREKKASSNT